MAKEFVLEVCITATVTIASVENVVPLHCSLFLLPGKDSTMLVSFNALRMFLLLNRMMVAYRGWSELSTANYMV